MDRCLIWKTSRGNAVERDLWWNQWQMLSQTFFLPASKNGLHSGLFHVGCIMNTKGCSLPTANFPDVFHLPIPCDDEKCMSFLSCSDNFPLFALVNYRRQIWGEMMEMCMVLLFQRANFTFFALFHMFTRSSEDCIPGFHMQFHSGVMMAWGLSRADLRWVLVLSLSYMILVQLIHSSKITNPNVF